MAVLLDTLRQRYTLGHQPAGLRARADQRAARAVWEWPSALRSSRRIPGSGRATSLVRPQESDLRQAVR